MKRSLMLWLGFAIFQTLSSQGTFIPAENVFRQMGTDFVTPNVYRNAAGAPGPMYWQQRADYQIRITLDDEKQQIHGSEVITYFNNSPDALNYLWIQLDQNVRERGSLRDLTTPDYMPERPASSGNGGFAALLSEESEYRFTEDLDGGFKIREVKDESGKDYPYTINYTMMRIDLEEPLGAGEKKEIHISWWYNINNQATHFGRSGMEYFAEDDNYLYTIAQFYPRMAAYTDFEGWQNKQFLGRSEFALTFGDFDVEIAAPSDHIIGATGVLVNGNEVLTEEQRQHLKMAAESVETPVSIFSEKEAKGAMNKKSKKTSTWHFKAENVRDFAFASSRRFIWDAMAVKFGERTVMAMSLYPPEGNPLWEQYSTRVVAHTLKVYSHHTFDYPYPVAWSVHGATAGMEYPMVSFNPGRPFSDGTYSEATKWEMIGVIIHEVGHNYFPMIVNSDERQWTWMDEGLNSFLEGIAEREWDHNCPSPMGRPRDIVDYMKGDQAQVAPIMTDGHLMVQFLANAYFKPATGLNILRETIMGRELFDFAFKQYALRWKFKHPTPEDFFRTMEDASAVDLDWFWRGWFYGTDHVDISIEDVKVFTEGVGNTETAIPEEIAVQRNREEKQSLVEQDPSMRDLYDSHEKGAGSKEETAEEYSGMNYVQIDFRNIGGMIMPLIIQFSFSDGTSEIRRIPAEIWSRNNLETSKVFSFEKDISSVVLDPFLETADCDLFNNNWPRISTPGRFELYKNRRR
ncbi:MAG: M1 family metallopeptidase [Bacteroides sp.]|nr:M1 family metallopeptidase [Bacteroides sp.]